MSSPVQDDRDKRAMYAPPWARDDRHDDEARRIHSDIVAAAERLKPASPPQRSAPAVETAAEEAREAWEQQPPSLDGAAMAEPHEARPRRRGWSSASRLAGAGGFAAVVALFVTGAIPLPAIDISLSHDQKDANAAAPSVAAVPPSTRPQAAAPQPTGAPKATVGLAPNAASPFPPPPKAVAEPAVPKPPSVLPEARVLDFMSREEIDGLLKRGQELLASGDISGGRLLLTRAAEAGDARASFALAATYDSAVVATLGVVGAFPDPVKARAWYAKAAEQGSAEAVRRLEQPHLRQQR